MSSLANRLEQAVQRGWANLAHLAELLELAKAPASNDPSITPEPLTDEQVQIAVDTYAQFLCDPPPALRGPELLRQAMRTAIGAAMGTHHG